MGETAKGILAVWTDLDPAAEPEFSAWYNREHLRERVEVPGFLNARRYRALSGGPRFFAAYDTESPAVLSSAVYRQPPARHTERSRRVFRSFRDPVRLVGALIGEAGAGTGGLVLTVRCHAQPGRAGELRAALADGLAQRLAEHPDVVALAVAGWLAVRWSNLRRQEAAAIATLRHEDQIRTRTKQLRAWTEALAGELRALGVRCLPSETYFFLADFAPHDAAALAARLIERDILVKPLGDARLGAGYMRVTTALPEDNARFVAALRELL